MYPILIQISNFTRIELRMYHGLIGLSYTGTHSTFTASCSSSADVLFMLDFSITFIANVSIFLISFFISECVNKILSVQWTYCMQICAPFTKKIFMDMTLLTVNFGKNTRNGNCKYNSPSILPCTQKNIIMYTHSFWPLLLPPFLEAGLEAQVGAHVTLEWGSVED